MKRKRKSKAYYAKVLKRLNEANDRIEQAWINEVPLQLSGNWEAEQTKLADMPKDSIEDVEAWEAGYLALISQMRSQVTHH